MCDMCDPEKKRQYLEALARNLEEGMVKVNIKLEDGGSESLWCEPVADGLLKVCNIPFFTNVCCIDDIIEARLMEDSDYMFEFHKAIERMTQGIYIQYETEDMEEDDIRKRYSVFVNSCNEHDFKVEAPIIGYAVVAVPYGQVHDSWRIIVDNVHRAGLRLLV